MGGTMMQKGFLAERYPILWDYSFIVRFAVLFAIWGSAGFDYKIFMDLSLRGVVLCLSFFVTSILVFVGYKTRASMLALAATLLIHGLTFHHLFSLAGAVYALLSTLLPIGAFYSVDRLIEVHAAPVPYQPSPQATARPAGIYSRLAFIILLIWNIGGPAYNQVFHHDSKLFLSWHMFHTIGRDLINVEFYTMNGQSREHVDYPGLLGHKVKLPGVHRNNRAVKDLRIVGVQNLDDLIARVCKRVDDPAALRLDARIATLKQGWRQLYDGQTPVCDAAGMPLLKNVPTVKDELVQVDDDT